MEIKAYAKLNLFLAITGKREDGYHNIETIMQSISLADRLVINKTNSGKIEIFSPSRFVPQDERNLAVKAAIKFFSYTNISNTGLSIKLYKQIPVGAGMGGGSSDAAAVLLAMNDLYKTQLSKKELAALASTIGADVSFCVYGGAMKAEGIGEILTPVPGLPNFPILVVKPPFSISTPKAYAALDNYEFSQIPTICEIEKALAEKNIVKICAYFSNMFEAPITDMYPTIQEIRDIMRGNGAYNAMMTGSGSAVFGVFPNYTTAKNAANQLPRKYGQRYICRPVDRILPD